MFLSELNRSESWPVLCPHSDIILLSKLKLGIRTKDVKADDLEKLA